MGALEKDSYPLVESLSPTFEVEHFLNKLYLYLRWTVRRTTWMTSNSKTLRIGYRMKRQSFDILKSPGLSIMVRSERNSFPKSLEERCGDENALDEMGLETDLKNNKSKKSRPI